MVRVVLTHHTDNSRSHELREMTKKARIYFTVPDSVTQEPTGPFCSDFDCESYSCKQAHRYQVLLSGGASREEALEQLGLGHLIDFRPESGDGSLYEPSPEVDHKVWKAFLRRATGQQREFIAQAVKAGLLPPTISNPRFSVHAGCSMCPCSPGFTADGARGHSFWLEVLA